MTAPIIMTSEDANAPIINSANLGSVVDFFQAVLVDGYGTQPGLGWTREFISADGKKAAWKSANNMYFKVDDSTHVESSGKNCQVYAYESMASIDLGYGSFCNDMWFAIGKNNDSPRWKIIGDVYGFWYFATPGVSTSNYQHNFVPHYVGMYAPAQIDNPFNNVLLGFYNYNYDCRIFTLLSSFKSTVDGIDCVFFQRSPDGYLTGGKQGYLVSPNGFFDSGDLGSANTNICSPVNGVTFFSKVYAGFQYKLVGQLPGLYNPIVRADLGYFPDEYYIFKDYNFWVFHWRSPRFCYKTPAYRLAMDIGGNFRTNIIS